MLRGGHLSCSNKCPGKKYKPVALDDLGQMEMLRLSESEAQELAEGEEETIFEADQKKR